MQIYRACAATINHNSVALCVRATDRTADEDRDQIELFVIAAYPNTGMPAIILPTLGMAGGKWDSSPCSVILLDFFSPSFSFSTDGLRIIFLCAHLEVAEVKQKKEKEKAVRSQPRARWR